MKKLSYILFLTLMYVYMYSPPMKFLMGTNPIYILLAISIGAFIICQKNFTLYLKPFKTEVFWFLGLALYGIVISGIEYDYMYALTHIISVLCIVTVIPFILFIAITDIFKELCCYMP